MLAQCTDVRKMPTTPKAGRPRQRRVSDECLWAMGVERGGQEGTVTDTVVLCVLRTTVLRSPPPQVPKTAARHTRWSGLHQVMGLPPLALPAQFPTERNIPTQAKPNATAPDAN